MNLPDTRILSIFTFCYLAMKELPLGHSSPLVSKGETGYVRKMFLGFLLAASSAMFISLVLSYAYSAESWHGNQFSFPRIFLFSTLVLSGSHWLFSRAMLALRTDRVAVFRKMIYGVCATALLFILLQVLGWYNLYSLGIFVSGRPNGSYLYLLSGLHAIHVLAGFLVLVFMTLRIYRRRRDPVDELLLLTQPQRINDWKLMGWYWSFIDILWLFLLFFFIFHHL